MKGNFQTVHTKETQAFQHKNFQALQLEWIHLLHENISGEGQTAQHLTATHVTVTELAR
jgi:hypothetical protein